MTFPIRNNSMACYKHTSALAAFAAMLISCYKHLKQRHQSMCILSKTCSIFRCLEFMWFHWLPLGESDYCALTWIGKIYFLLSQPSLLLEVTSRGERRWGKGIYENIKYLRNIPNTFVLLLSFRNVTCVNAFITPPKKPDLSFSAAIQLC